MAARVAHADANFDTIHRKTDEISAQLRVIKKQLSASAGALTRLRWWEWGFEKLRRAQTSPPSTSPNSRSRTSPTCSTTSLPPPVTPTPLRSIFPPCAASSVSGDNCRDSHDPSAGPVAWASLRTMHAQFCTAPIPRTVSRAAALNAPAAPCPRRVTVGTTAFANTHSAFRAWRGVARESRVLRHCFATDTLRGA